MLHFNYERLPEYKTHTGVFPFLVSANDRGAQITEDTNRCGQRLTFVQRFIFRLH